jgi:hypothetical protein
VWPSLFGWKHDQSSILGHQRASNCSQYTVKENNCDKVPRVVLFLCHILLGPVAALAAPWIQSHLLNCPCMVELTTTLAPPSQLAGGRRQGGGVISTPSLRTIDCHLAAPERSCPISLENKAKDSEKPPRCWSGFTWRSAAGTKLEEDRVAWGSHGAKQEQEVRAGHMAARAAAGRLGCSWRCGVLPAARDARRRTRRKIGATLGVGPGLRWRVATGGRSEEGRRRRGSRVGLRQRDRGEEERRGIGDQMGGRLMWSTMGPIPSRPH